MTGLYGISTESLDSVNHRAHPGGGTETIELESGEGLVEDQYEAHLKNLYVAYRQPTAGKLASLAKSLEDAGFDKTAAQVDAILADFFLPDIVKSALANDFEAAKEAVVSNIQNLKFILESAGVREWGWVHSVVSKDTIIAYTDHLATAVLSVPVDFQKAKTALDFLSNEELLYGSFTEIAEVDLERVLGPKFKQYLDLLEKVKVGLAALEKYDPATGQPVPQAQPAAQNSATNAWAAELQQVNDLIADYKALQFEINNKPDGTEDRIRALMTPAFVNSIKILKQLPKALEDGTFRPTPENKQKVKTHLTNASYQIKSFDMGLAAIK